jgi:hypothetical protein
MIEQLNLLKFYYEQPLERVEVRYNISIAHEEYGEQNWKVSICLFGKKWLK